MYVAVPKSSSLGWLSFLCPLDTQSWIIIGLTVCVSATILSLPFYVLGKRDGDTYNFSTSLMATILLLVQQGIP